MREIRVSVWKLEIQEKYRPQTPPLKHVSLAPPTHIRLARETSTRAGSCIYVTMVMPSLAGQTLAKKGLARQTRLYRGSYLNYSSSLSTATLPLPHSAAGASAILALAPQVHCTITHFTAATGTLTHLVLWLYTGTLPHSALYSFDSTLVATSFSIDCRYSPIFRAWLFFLFYGYQI